MSRIAAKRQSEVKNQDELGDESSSEKGFIRKKLLTKELPKVESVDFLESYSVKDEGVNQYSLLKLSNLGKRKLTEIIITIIECMYMYVYELYYRQQC